MGGLTGFYVCIELMHAFRKVLVSLYPSSCHNDSHIE